MMDEGPTRVREHWRQAVSGPVWSTPWKAGPEAMRPPPAPVLLSITEFTADRPWHAPGILAAGLRLRRSWPRTGGAVGLRLWMDADPWHPRSGSVSAWTDEPSLRAFLNRPDHLRVMRAFKGRGRIRSHSRILDRWEPEAVWEWSRQRLTGEVPWPQQSPEPGSREKTIRTIVRANIPLVSTLAEGPNQGFKEELDRLIDEQLFPQGPCAIPTAAESK